MQTGPAPAADAPNALPPWRGASQTAVVNANNGGASLAGGWITGPGNSKFTYPQVCISECITKAGQILRANMCLPCRVTLINCQV